MERGKDVEEVNECMKSWRNSGNEIAAPRHWTKGGGKWKERQERFIEDVLYFNIVEEKKLGNILRLVLHLNVDANYSNMKISPFL